MKKRMGFVSNSSSSSFIVISDSSDMIEMKSEDISIENIVANGTTEFGWQDEEYRDFYSRFAWAAIIGEIVGPDDWEEKMMEAINSVYPDAEIDFTEINWEGYDWYIDHQSCDMDGGDMYNSKTSMVDWLFRKNSYIQCGNDN